MSNQDASGVLRLRHGWLAIICDGMGGFRGGEVASRMAVASMIQYFKQVAMSEDIPLNQYLADAIAWANHQIWEYAQRHPEVNQMGTTVVAILCYRQWAYIAHVGDSRLYLLRDGVLLRLTKDHSMVQRLIDAGEISEEDAMEHPRSNIISRVVGHSPEIDVESQETPILLAAGDRWLLCTDGLYRMVHETDICYQLRDGQSPQVICDTLIDMANRAGGRDNITVQVIDCRTTISRPSVLVICAFVLALLSLLIAGWIMHPPSVSDLSEEMLAPLPNVLLPISQQGPNNPNTQPTTKPALDLQLPIKLH
jgi:protein phosphatase